MFKKSQTLKLSERLKKNATDRPGVIWLQGEDRCGLAVIAVTLEHVLVRQGYAVTLLDHDQINSGLCSDLSGQSADRQEYARRVAETAKLFDEANLLTIIMVDPLSKSEELQVREVLQKTCFSSVYLQFPESSPVEPEIGSGIKCVPEQLVRQFIRPENPELHLNTANVRTEDTINGLLAHLDQRGSLLRGYSALASAARKSPRANAGDGVPISIAAG